MRNLHLNLFQNALYLIFVQKHDIGNAIDLFPALQHQKADVDDFIKQVVVFQILDKRMIGFPADLNIYQASIPLHTFQMLSCSLINLD
ncbi:hypothetical protein SDC9_178113 [bioreactor metagenome]|uniref:Uncharacterized protein n=1 Tax=bioreactor metagenome TaxID=1076179 RepID=A0A645GX75_9ZZZZ